MKQYFPGIPSLLVVTALASACGVNSTPVTPENSNSPIAKYDATVNLDDAYPFYRTSMLPHRLSNQDDAHLDEIVEHFHSKLKGWDYLFALLIKEGIDPDYLAKVFSDPLMPRYQKVYFNLNPKESSYLYRQHNTPSARENALKFYQNNKYFFELAEEAYGVPPEIVLAVLQVETKCGNYTGGDRVFYRLARLATTSAPDNIQGNFARLQRRDRSVTLDQVKSRANWLTETFMPHLVGAIVIAQEQNTHPLELKGSPAGAMGMPQFLPGNIIYFGVDANQDNRVNLFDASDAILSTAYFLHKHGWSKTRLSRAEQEAILWNYNRSKPYIDTVLSMSKLLSIGIKKLEA